MRARAAVRLAVADDAEALDRALQNLSADLGDPHRVGAGEIAASAFRAEAVFHALIATNARGVVDGFAFVSPVFSSVRGGAGSFISDLWVAPDLRGTGLGRQLLSAVAEFGTTRWNARFLKLSVYDRSPQSRAFYARMGFAEAAHEKVLYLTDDSFQSLAAVA